MKLNKRISGFLAASFLSTFGDTLLVIALPMGIGQETGDISIALLAWFIPSVAVIISSYVSKVVHKRTETERVDYGLLLLVIAVFEIIFGVGVHFTQHYVTTLLLIMSFIFLYAIAKEGISRLIYNISIYRFFCRPEHYSDLSGKKAGLDIAASLLGVMFAAYLVGSENWRYALIIDASTFFILGLMLLFIGRDPEPAKDPTEREASMIPSLTGEKISHTRWVVMGVPLLHAVNALYAYFQPLIVEKADIMTASHSLFFLSLMRLPSMVGGLFFNRLTTHLAAHRIVAIFPVIYVLSSAVFVMMPNTETMLLTMFVGGINIAIYTPAYINVLNALPRADIIEANKVVLRSIGFFQGSACLVSMYLYSSEKLPTLSVIAAMFVFILLSLIPARIVSIKLHHAKGRQPYCQDNVFSHKNQLENK